MMPKMDHQSIEVGGVTGLVGGMEAARQRPGALVGAGSWQQQQGGGWQGSAHEGTGTSMHERGSASMHESSPLLGNGSLSPLKGVSGGSSGSGSSGDGGLPLVTSLSSALASEVIYCTVSAGESQG